MGLFDIFKKDTNYQLPSEYQGILDKVEYTLVLDISIKYLTEKGRRINRVENGEIEAEIDGETQYFRLDNLVRLLHSNDKNIWIELIYEHFDKLNDNNSAYDYFFKYFEYARQLLRVFIKGDDPILQENISELVFRTDFSLTNTFLVIEFEEQFRYLTHKDIDEWNVSLDELFAIAISNIPDDEIEVRETFVGDKFTVYMFISGDYSSALMLDLKNKADYSIGTFGSLIAIPTKGSAFVHPIESNDILELIEFLFPIVEKFYDEDPGNITTNFYWYYNDVFQLFPVGEDDNGHFIRIPENLIQLLHNHK